MASLIRVAFLHNDEIGKGVDNGHYDLNGPDGEIILAQVWETLIQPDWEISMKMWKQKYDPLVDPFASLGLGGLGDIGVISVPDEQKPKKKRSKSKKDTSPKPPPPSFPPGINSIPSDTSSDDKPVRDKEAKKDSSVQSDRKKKWYSLR